MKKEGLRMEQASGAVAKDGGQSKIDCGQYTSIFTKSQVKKKEDAMKSVIHWTLCAAISIAAHAAVIGGIMLLSM